MIDKYWKNRAFDYLLKNDFSIAEEYEEYLAEKNKNDKKKNGQYYTPQDVSIWMAEKFCDIWKGQLIIDPCCGCGNLIVEVIKKLKLSWEEVKQKVVLFDIDETALFISKVVIAKQYGIKDFVEIEQIKSYNEDFLLFAKNNNFLNSLIIANPPYGKCDNSSYKDSYQTANLKNWYPLFLEAFAKYSDGFVAITPQSFLGSGKYKTLRGVLSDKKEGNIWAFDNVPSNIFIGKKKGVFNTNTNNSVRAAVIQSINGNRGFKISPLIRWKIEERNQLFNYADKHLSNLCWSGQESWGKIPVFLENFYSEYMKKSGLKVQNLVSNSGEYSLYIPTTPRYFTSASCKKLNRSQQLELRFKTKKDRDAVYLLLVSSFAYAWWRFFDGEITLTKTMVLNMPVPQSALDNYKIAQNIQKKEDQYIVCKMNAGKKNENIKFPKETISYLNNILFKDGELLIQLHKNCLTDIIK